MKILFTTTIIITSLIIFCYCGDDKSKDQQSNVPPSSNCQVKKRVRRQIKVTRNLTIGKGNEITGTIGVRGTISNVNRHLLTAEGQISKQINPDKPFVYNTALNYNFPHGKAVFDFTHTENKPGKFSGKTDFRIYTSDNGRLTIDGNLKVDQSIGKPINIGGGFKLKYLFYNQKKAAP